MRKPSLVIRLLALVVLAPAGACTVVTSPAMTGDATPDASTAPGVADAPAPLASDDVDATGCGAPDAVGPDASFDAGPDVAIRDTSDASSIGCAPPGGEDAGGCQAVWICRENPLGTGSMGSGQGLGLGCPKICAGCRGAGGYFCSTEPVGDGSYLLRCSGAA